jgi:hypothetical protein
MWSDTGWYAPQDHDGRYFVFIKWPVTHIKLLQWEGHGFGLYYKRLERGTFERPAGMYDSATMSISSEQLSLILQGISLQHIRKQKRYHKRPDAVDISKAVSHTCTALHSLCIIEYSDDTDHHHIRSSRSSTSKGYSWRWSSGTDRY